MNSSAAPSFLLLSFLFFFFSSASAFNITKILNQHPDYSTFNSLLTQTRVSAAINRRRTITVLAVENSAISPLMEESIEVIKAVLSVHTILDYYDMQKLKNMNNRSILLTNLFQSSGMATNQQGFLNVTKYPSDEIKVGSATDDKYDLSATIVGKIETRPYDIAVLQVSSVIIPTAIENSTMASPPAKSPKKAPSPAPAADTPNSDAPAADAPADDSPASSPGDGPAADDSGSSTTRVAFGTCIGFVMVLACMAAI